MENNILQKIKKLMALSESPNEAEALSAAAKASDLLAKYNLSMSDVEAASSEVAGQSAEELNKRIPRWKAMVASGVASLNFCDTVLSYRQRKSSIMVVGKEHNRIATIHMYEYLIAAVNRLAKEVPGSMRKSFRQGAAWSLVERLAELLKMRMEQGLEGSTRSLVVSVYQNAERENRNWMDANMSISKSNARSSTSDSIAASHGYNRAKEISLNSQVKGSNSHSRQLPHG